MEFKVHRAGTKSDMIAELKALKERFERGEIQVAALRYYRKDGSFEDVVLGGETEDDRQQALADLHRNLGSGLH